MLNVYDAWYVLTAVAVGIDPQSRGTWFFVRDIVDHQTRIPRVFLLEGFTHPPIFDT